MRSRVTQEMLITCWMTHSWQMVVTTPSPNTLSRAWPLLYRPSRIFWTKQISKNELVLSQSPLATTLLLSLGISMIEHFLDWEFWRLLFAHMDKDEAAHQKVQWLICIPKLAFFTLIYSDFRRPVHNNQLQCEVMTIKPKES